jgi:large subunit ribosomal protein L13
MRTFMEKPAHALATRKWWVVDAENQPLGRLATRVSSVLRGKHKASFTPHVDAGDFVIVVNASRVKLTGNKVEAKRYYSHSGYPGAIRSIAFRDLVQKHPEIPIQRAVRGMLPKNVLGRQLLTKLKVYATREHPHQAQKPEPLVL